MRKHLVIPAIVIAVAASAPLAQAGCNVGIDIGIPAPVIAAPPVAVEPPEFVAQPGAGFYIAVGTANDMFYAGDRYYLYRDNAWYAAPYYNGPWASIGYRAVPWRLRRYPLARLHSFRDEWGRHRGEGYYAGYGRFRPERHAGWEGGRHAGMMGY